MSHKQYTKRWSQKKKKLEMQKVQTWTQSKSHPSTRKIFNFVDVIGINDAINHYIT